MISIARRHEWEQEEEPWRRGRPDDVVGVQLINHRAGSFVVVHCQPSLAVLPSLLLLRTAFLVRGIIIGCCDAADTTRERRRSITTIIVVGSSSLVGSRSSEAERYSSSLCSRIRLSKKA